MAMQRTVRMTVEIEVDAAGLTSNDLEKRLQFMRDHDYAAKVMVRTDFAIHFNLGNRGDRLPRKITYELLPVEPHQLSVDPIKG